LSAWPRLDKRPIAAHYFSMLESVNDIPLEASNALRGLTLQINEMFFSVQGESSLVGWPTVFVRTMGCNIRCKYCDTKYSYYEGSRLTAEDILHRIESHKVKHVCVTGGEPMAQAKVIPFMKMLCDLGYVVSLETNGYYDTGEVDKRVIKVIDIKTPDSGEMESFNYKNLEAIQPHDNIKFVICSEKDYLWAKALILEKRLYDKCTVFMSPSFEEMPTIKLAENILRDSLPTRLQVQLHKYIWSPHTRGV
jgi:7-carboxy-7-deazaguanine synthase